MCSGVHLPPQAVCFQKPEPLGVSEMLPEVRQNTSHHIFVWLATDSNAEFSGWDGENRLAELPRGAMVVQDSQDCSTNKPPRDCFFHPFCSALHL